MQLNNSGFDKRKVFIFILAVIIGFGCVGVGYWSFNKQISNAEAKTNIVVPARNIAANSTINAEDLQVISVSLPIVDKYTVTQSAELVNKVASIPLYKEKPIDKRTVVKAAQNMQGKGIVGVNIDAARSAGVVAGDMVDVYWLTNSSSTNNNPASALANVPIARNAVVLKIGDVQGKAIAGETTLQQGVATVSKTQNDPKIVYLILNQEEVARVISGSAPNNTNIALVKISQTGE